MEHVIKVLGDLEHIKQKPGMYIGSTENVHPLINEVLDNSLDELVNGYASTVYMDEKDKWFLVADDGRGIPIHNVKIEGKSVDSVIAIATKLFSSSKFDASNIITVGQHGVGLTVVNALSESLTIITKSPRSLYYNVYSFRNGQFVHKETIHKEQYNEMLKKLPFVSENLLLKQFNTIVAFKPDKQYFETLDWNEDYVRERLKTLLALRKLLKTNSKEQILLRNEIVEVEEESLFKELLGFTKDDIPLFRVEAKKDKKHLLITLTYDISEDASILPKTQGFVNYKRCDGVHINLILNEIVKQFPDKDIVNTEYAKHRLRLLVSLLVPGPQFDSQTKTRFTGRSQIIELIDDNLRAKIRQALNSEYIQNSVVPLIKQYMMKRKLERNANKQLKVTAGNPVRLGHHIKTLYIVEGQSASGTLLQCRTDDESVFPLMGKVLNVETSRLEMLSKNKHIKYLAELMKHKWAKVVTLADPDPDGLHITILVSLLMNKLFPDYLVEGKFQIVTPPLYGVKYKNDIKFFDNYSDIPVELRAYTTRYKGLGEMTPKELRLILDKKHYYHTITKIPEEVVELIVKYKKKLVEIEETESI